jgi:hypothetical protein
MRRDGPISTLRCATCSTRDRTVGLVSHPTPDGRHTMAMCSKCLTRFFGAPPTPADFDRPLTTSDFVLRTCPTCGAADGLSLLASRADGAVIGCEPRGLNGGFAICSHCRARHSYAPPLATN